LLAKNKEALEDMIGTFRKFLRMRKLELNEGKSKILVFNRGNNEKKEIWKWKDERIEEVQIFKYLRFMFNKKGNNKEHIKELINKGRIAVRKIWGLGERMCRNDLIRRWNLFKYLVTQSVISYGVELWGGKKKKELEKIMMDYVRWIFRLDYCTSRYVITWELGMDKLKIGWGIRVKRFEEKIKNREGNLVELCWKEKEKGERGNRERDREI